MHQVIVLVFQFRACPGQIANLVRSVVWLTWLTHSRCSTFPFSEVRWSHVSRLLRALCSFAANGQVWRIGGHEHEAMHKLYDTEHSGSGYAQRKAPGFFGLLGLFGCVGSLFFLGSLFVSWLLELFLILNIW